MNRRKFMLGLGSVAGGGALAMGTGAFSSVEAQRNIDVTVADDANAYLSIAPTDEPNGNYADTTSSDTLQVNLTEKNDNIGSGIAGGEGLNTNALTTMADVFEVRNQGTQDVILQTTPLLYLDWDLGNNNYALLVFLVPQSGYITFHPGFMSIKALNAGEKITFGLVGFAVPEGAINSAEISEEVEFTAEAP